MKPEYIERIKDLLPTTLGSDEIREKLAADILRRSIFSARMASVPYLAKLREVCAQISAGAINQADARAQLLSTLEQLGFTGERSEVERQVEGGRLEAEQRTVKSTVQPSTYNLQPGITNPASIRRLNLIVDTQRQMAASVSRLMGQTEATLYANPAWELTRLGHRDAPRADWAARWRAAGDSVGWQGALKDRFIALKTSPIWQALGDGAGGFLDTLRNPYPPFAYGSGLGWVAVDRETCERYGLVGDPSGAERSPRPTDAGSPSSPSLSPDEQSLADAVKRYGFPEIAEGLS